MLNYQRVILEELFKTISETEASFKKLQFYSKNNPPRIKTIPSHLWGQIPCRHGKGHLHFLVPGGVVIPGSSKAAWSSNGGGSKRNQSKKKQIMIIYISIS